jgi:hypothetical protein
MLKVNDSRVVPGITVNRPDGSKAKFSVYTDADKQLTSGQPGGGPGVITLEDIIAAKEAIALDAADGKLDFKAGGLELERPRYTIFWSNNSASAMMMALAQGQRELTVNGKKVEVSSAYKSWVMSTMTLESMPG